MPPPNCPEVYPWFMGPGPHLACQGPFTDSNQALMGCAVGCGPCKQQTRLELLENAGVATKGRRWLRPDDVSESRDARGRYTWPKSGFAVRLPRGTTVFQLAMCFAQRFGDPAGWIEWWDKNICDCRSGAVGDSPYEACSDFEPGCRTDVPGNWVTCNWFVGIGWPPTLRCTGELLGADPEPIAFSPSGLGNAAIVRAPGIDDFIGFQKGCMVGLNVPCIGEWAASQCPAAPPPYQGTINIEQPGAALWGFMRIDEIAARYYDDAAEPFLDHAVVAAKNVVLNWIDQNRSNMPPRTTGAAQNLDQVDLEPQDVHLWSRGWNDHGNEGWIGIGELPLPGRLSDGSSPVRFENCFCKYSGHRIIAEWVPWGIALRLHAIFLREDRNLHSSVCDNNHNDTWWDRRRAVYPLIKIRLEVTMAIRAQFAEPGLHQLVRDHLPEDDPQRTIDLEIVTRGDQVDQWHQKYPIIVDANGSGDAALRPEVDSIVYVDNQGRRFDGRPPKEFTWVAEMGPLRGPWPDVYNHTYRTGQLCDTCCGLATGLAGTQVLHEYSHPDLDDESLGDSEDPRRSRSHTGHITFSPQTIRCFP